ncbi:MAG: c-type cytochrome domain-containing protein [Opitutaceae bacterium]
MTAVTIVLGLVYEIQGAYEEEVNLHRLWGYIFGGAVLVNYVFYWLHRAISAGFSKWIYLFTLGVSTIAMTVTGHQGGELVHGKSFLIKSFRSQEVPPVAESSTPSALDSDTVEISDTMQSDSMMADSMMGSDMMADEMMGSDMMADEMMGSDMMADEMMDPMTTMDPMVAVATPPLIDGVSDEQLARYEAAQLIFKNNCYACHGATKQKGDFRMDTEAEAYAGGKSKEPSIVPHDAEASSIVKRIRLPRHHDDAMPPEKKPAVSAEGLEAVVAWINDGAVWPDPRALRKIRPSTYVEIDDAPTEKVINALNATGAKAEYNAWDDARLRVDLSFTDADQLDQAIAQLAEIKDKLIWLDVGQLKLPASFFEQLTEYENLERLYLNGTNVSDVNVAKLKALTKLDFLNVYNTQLTDQSLEALKAVPSLKQVFLGETKFTKEGVKSLRSARPELEVVHR